MILLGMYTAARFYFLAVNAGDFAGAPRREIARAFLQGLRFDLSFLLFWNIPLIFAELLPGGRLGPRQPTWERWRLRLFALINLPPLITNLLDAEYFPFRGRRSTFGVLALRQDIVDQGAQLLRHYWHVSLIATAVVVLLWWTWGALERQRAEEIALTPLSYLAAWLVVLALVPFGVRSGLQSKPLGTWHACVFSSSALGALALNTPFSLWKGNTVQILPGLRHFASTAAAEEVLRAGVNGRPHFAPTRDNVVIFLLEGFSLEHFGYGGRPWYMPFLRSLADRGLYFENSFANGQCTMEAQSSILAGIPALMIEPYVTSIYNGNRVFGLATALKERGYASAFFCGGRNGSMYLDLMGRLAGFERYYGRNEYPDPGRDAGEWGIHDEPFLQWVADRLARTPEPFVVGIFTLSSHNPFTIPQEYAGRFPKGTRPIHESLGYADYALGRFFEKARASPWFDRTLFVLTGDHSVLGDNPRFLSDLGKARVPMIFYTPSGRIPPQASRRLVQHVDILPSVLDYLGFEPAELPRRPLPFGRSVFEDQAPGRVVHQTAGYYFYLSDGLFARLAREGDRATVEMLDDDLLGGHAGVIPDARSKRIERELQAAIQFFNNGLNENSWFGASTDR